MVKKKVLCWSDSSIAGTGFGVVSKHVLGTLHRTGRYDIHHLAINFHGEFVDTDEVPWQQQPAKLLDPSDPHGMKMFIKTLMKGIYDIVWVCNDLYVTHEVAIQFRKVKQALLAKGKKIPTLIYYYPVDCEVPPDGCAFLKEADVPVCYTDYGRAKTLQTLPEVRDRLKQIPHGVDSSVYMPLPPEAVDRLKESFLGVSPETTVVLSVNRNSARKQIPYSFLAFKEFKKQVPNSIMYVHANPNDQGGRLDKAIHWLGLSPKTDIIFPLDYSPSKPVPASTLNKIYNTADIFLSTHLGEGWGLSLVEAMASGVPVVTGNNTCMPQIFGEESERGYLYPCNDTLWIDNSGFRKKGLIPDIVDKMVEAYQEGPKWVNPKVEEAYKWTQEHTWEVVNKAWIDIFREAEESQTVRAQSRSAPSLLTEEI